MRNSSEWLSSEQLCARADISYRQLTYLIETEVIDDPRDERGIGYSRSWSPEQVRTVCLLSQLRAAGADVFVLRAVAAEVCWWGEERWSGPIFISLDGSITRELPRRVCFGVDLDSFSEPETLAA